MKWRKIYQIKKELTEIEAGLEEHLKIQSNKVTKESGGKIDTLNPKASEENKNSKPLPYSEEFLLELSVNNPKIFEKIMKDSF